MRCQLAVSCLVCVAALALALPAPAQEHGDEETVVGYVLSFEGGRLVLSNVPLATAGGGMQVWSVDPDSVQTQGEGAQPGQQMIVIRRGAGQPGEEDGAEAEEEPTVRPETSAESEEAPEQGSTETDGTDGAEAPEDARGSTVVFQPGGDGPGEGDGEGSGQQMMFVMAGPGAAAGEASDQPLELSELVVPRGVEGVELLVPGARVEVLTAPGQPLPTAVKISAGAEVEG